MQQGVVGEARTFDKVLSRSTPGHCTVGGGGQCVRWFERIDAHTDGWRALLYGLCQHVGFVLTQQGLHLYAEILLHAMCFVLFVIRTTLMRFFADGMG